MPVGVNPSNVLLPSLTTGILLIPVSFFVVLCQQTPELCGKLQIHVFRLE